MSLDVRLMVNSTTTTHTIIEVRLFHPAWKRTYIHIYIRMYLFRAHEFIPEYSASDRESDISAVHVHVDVYLRGIEKHCASLRVGKLVTA